MPQSINLIPQEEKQEQSKTQLVKLSTLFTILLLIVVGLLSAYFFYQVTGIKGQIREHENNIEDLRTEIQGLSTIEISARNLDTRFHALKSIYTSRVYFSGLLDEINKHVPETIILMDMTVNPGNKVTITGESNDYISISKFITDLSADEKIFATVTLNSVSLENRANKITFFILVEYKPEALMR